MSNAKQVQIPRGAFSLAQRIFEESGGKVMSRQGFHQAWNAEKFEVVQAVVLAVEVMIEQRGITKANISRAKYLAEEETINFHKAKQDETYGPDFETFVK